MPKGLDYHWQVIINLSFFSYRVILLMLDVILLLRSRSIMTGL